jgi:hypothetical protein
VFGANKHQRQQTELNSHLHTRVQQWSIRRHNGHNSGWAETKYWQSPRLRWRGLSWKIHHTDSY